MALSQKADVMRVFSSISLTLLKEEELKEKYTYMAKHRSNVQPKS
jgi:hypothetical protein